MRLEKTNKTLFLVLSSFLIIIFTNQVVNKSFYIHSHLLPDGTIISHAHPYDKSGENTPFKSHSHRQCELLILQNIELLFLQVLLIFVLRSISKKIGWKNIFELGFKFIFYGNLKGRSPPALKFLFPAPLL